jgi:hypothetical protein
VWIQPWGWSLFASVESHFRSVLADADEKKHDEPDEELANAADKEHPGEETDHPTSLHAHEGEGHEDVETEDADDKAVLEPPGGDDYADVSYAM